VARVVDIGQHAEGVIAIGQFATGVIAIGQVATGVIAIGQVARGVVAIGMVAFGLFALGMVSLGVAGSSGMLAFGGRVGFRIVGVPLAPFLPRKPSAGWAVISAVQLGALVGASILFWRFVASPLGDTLLGPGGIVRGLSPP
jgi:hypothetical protein